MAGDNLHNPAPGWEGCLSVSLWVFLKRLAVEDLGRWHFFLNERLHQQKKLAEVVLGQESKDLDFRATEGTGAVPSWFALKSPFLSTMGRSWWLGFWCHPLQVLEYSHPKTSGGANEPWFMEKDRWFLLELQDSRSKYTVQVSSPRVLIKSNSCSCFCV